MAATKLRLYGLNRLVAGTVTVSGTATGFPATNLYDGSILYPWTDSANSGTRFARVDQGSALAVNGYAVGPGHNLAGATVLFRSSPDAATWTTRDTTVVGSGTAAYAVSIAELSIRHWGIEITGAAAAPSIPELFISRAFDFPRFISEGGAAYGLGGNWAEHTSLGGYDWRLEHGDPRWFAEYVVRDIEAADRTLLETLFGDINGGASFFFLMDADGVARWVKWEGPELRWAAAAVLRQDVRLAFRQVLS